MGIQAFNEIYPVNVSAFLVNGNGTTPTPFNSSIYTQFRLDTIIASSTDTADHKIELILFDGVFSYVIGVIDVPAGAGNGTVPLVDVIAALPTSMQANVVQAVNYFLQIRAQVAVTAAKQINFVGVGGSL